MNRPYKIAVFIDQLLPGGVQKAAIEEVKNLNKLGIDTKLVILMRKGFEKAYEYLVINTPYEFLSDRYPFFLRKSFKLPIFKFLSTLHLISPFLAPLAVKSPDYDLIISHGTTTSLTTWPLSIIHKIPYFAVIHDPMIYILDKVYAKTPLRYLFPIIKPIANFLEKRFVKAAKICLVDSSVHVKFLKKNYSVNPQILYLGVIPPKIISPNRGKKIISFGRWDKGKNPDILLEIISKIPGVYLIVAGTWSSHQDLNWFKKLIKKNNLNNRVELITSYNLQDLTKICRQGRFWIHPHFEAFSLSALEAASHGLPIIIPKKSGITELFINKKHGFFPSSVTVNEFTKLSKKLINNKRLANQMGIKAAKLVKKFYTPKSHALKLASLIKKVLPSNTNQLIALETGHVGKTSIAGGDLLLEQMAKRVVIPLEITVIVPEKNINHWLNSGLKINLYKIKSSFFDKFTGPWGVFITYVIRIIKTTLIIYRMKIPRSSVIYSSTGIFPDILPAYLVKLTNPNYYWVSRIHHLLAPLSQRPGKYWVNIGSLILQQISLLSIKAKADLVLALNQNLKKQLQKLGFKSSKIVVLGGGVNYHSIVNLKPSSTKKYDAIFLGRLHPVKGIYDLPIIWSYVISRLSNAKLAIIGPGSEDAKKNLQKSINKYQLGRSIDVLGFLPQKQVWSHLKNSKVFLFTDHEAGFGLAVTEAMAAGCVVIGYNIGILGSVFTSGYIKIPLNDHQAYALQITKILKNEKLRSQISKLAQKEASKHDWQIASGQFAKILNRMST